MKNILRSIPRAVVVGILVAALLVTGALAYLSASTSGLVNTFEPAKETDPGILEGSDGNTFNGITKEQVKVNVGDPGYAVYVRAAIVVNWKDGSGNIHASAPKLDTDYTITLNTTDGDPWFLGSDGFYYHKAPIAYDGQNASTKYTSVLINECKRIGTAPTDDYHLSVEIIAQTIQALGTTDNDANGDPVAVGIPAVEDAWKVVTVDGNLNLTPKT